MSCFSFYFAVYSTAIMKIIFRRYSGMKRLKNLAIFTGSLVCICAPTVLMIIGIWMIYNVGIWIGSVIGLAGYIGTLYAYYVNMIENK